MYAPAVWSPVYLGRGCGDDGGREPGDTTSLKHGTKCGEILQRKTGRQRENESYPSGGLEIKKNRQVNR